MTKLYTDFFKSEKAGGIVLVFCAILSMWLANQSFGNDYISFFQSKVGPYSLELWINDGLMAIFFLLVGLEIEREVYIGELSKPRQALLPIIAALGGMIVPAGIHYYFNAGTPFESGFGIPMATDIAFSIGILSLLGKRIPTSLKIFLVALAIIDDLGAIIIIALFYTSEIQWIYLSLSLGIFGVLLLFNRLQKLSLWWYLPAGALMWYFMHESGIHATITGVLLAFAIPFGTGKFNSPSYQLQHHLHYPVALLIVPLFALCNTCIPFSMPWGEVFQSSNAYGIIGGLAVGKPLGITLFVGLGALFGWTSKPSDVSWTQLMGAGWLAGIGFTMSIFITLLAFDDLPAINQSKLAIIGASMAAGLLGFLVLFLSGKKTHWSR